MTRRRFSIAAAGVLCAALLHAAPAAAQVFGTFSWQMQPYCNVITLTLTSTPAGFALDGIDNQCGAANKASASGFASFNSGGNVTLNFSIVTAVARTVQVSAIVSPTTGSGAWTDSVGNSGTMALAASTGGAPRPLPSSGLAPSVITTVEIAPGAVGGTDINAAEVQARVSGGCPPGQAISAINANGTVTCEPIVSQVVIGGSAFVAQGANNVGRSSGGCAFSGSPLYASFQLPIGYRVTSVSARVLDFDAGADLAVEVLHYSGAALTPLATVATTGSPGVAFLTEAVAAPIPLNQGDSVYAVFTPGTSTTNLQICSVQLTLAKS